MRQKSFDCRATQVNGQVYIIDEKVDEFKIATRVQVNTYDKSHATNFFTFLVKPNAKF